MQIAKFGTGAIRFECENAMSLLKLVVALPGAAKRSQDRRQKLLPLYTGNCEEGLCQDKDSQGPQLNVF